MSIFRPATITMLAILLMGCSKSASPLSTTKTLTLTGADDPTGVQIELPKSPAGGKVRLLVSSTKGETVTVRFERMEINLVGPKDWKPFESKVMGTAMEAIELDYPSEAFSGGSAKLNRKFSYTTSTGYGQVEENDVAPPNPGFSTDWKTGRFWVTMVEPLSRDLEVELRSMQTKRGERLPHLLRLRIPAGKLEAATDLTVKEPTQVAYAFRLLPNTYWTTGSIPLHR